MKRTRTIDQLVAAGYRVTDKTTNAQIKAMKADLADKREAEKFRSYRTAKPLAQFATAK